jgi:Tfp pilus assembly protein PilF
MMRVQHKPCQKEKKRADWPAHQLKSNQGYFFSIIFLHSAFILSSALAGSIFLHSSIFLSSFMAPPCEAAMELKETVAKVAAITTDRNLLMGKLRLFINRLPTKWLVAEPITRMVIDRLTGLLRIRVFFLFLPGALLAAGSHAAPRTPAADTEVLEKLLIRVTDSAARELAALRAALAKSPTNVSLATDLAQRYFDLALAQGDPRYVGYAEAVVARFANPLPAPLLTLRGVMRQYRHDFVGALKDFEAALAVAPDYAAAHAWRGAIYLVQADYAAAKKECTALRQLSRNTLAGACLGLMQAYSGQLAAGYATLRQTLNQATDPDSRLWLLTRLGEVAAWRGQDAQAQAHYREALSLGRDDVYLLAAWTDYLLDAGQSAEVVRLLAKWESADSLLLRLAEAEALLKLPEAARHQKMLSDRFAAARARGDATHRAEEARFELRLRQDLQVALRLAQENYAVQREPRDARVLLEAAIAAKDPASAQVVRDWLSRSGFEDARTRSLAQAPESAGATGSKK